MYTDSCPSHITHEKIPSVVVSPFLRIMSDERKTNLQTKCTHLGRDSGIHIMMMALFYRGLIVISFIFSGLFVWAMSVYATLTFTGFQYHCCYKKWSWEIQPEITIEFCYLIKNFYNYFLRNMLARCYVVSIDKLCIATLMILQGIFHYCHWHGMQDRRWSWVNIQMHFTPDS